MNSKKAKALRKMMRNVQLTDSGKNLEARGYLEDTSRAKTMVVTSEELRQMGYDVDALNNQDEGQIVAQDEGVIGRVEGGQLPTRPTSHQVKINRGPISNDPKSLRGIYLHFKNELAKIETQRKSK